MVPYNVTTDGASVNFKVPGVMVLDWYPYIGKSELATDPASVLGKEMYARVRAAYSGTLRADAPDYVVYVMCLDSIFAYIAWLKRLYRTLSAYNPANYVIPDTLLGSMGLSQADIQSLRINKTKLWQLINELVHQSRKFTCPGSLDIMNRHYWMSDNIYMDDNTLNSQIYMFNLRGVYRYTELQTEPTPSEIKASGAVLTDLPWVRYGENPEVLTPETLYEFGRDLIDRMVDWDDSYTINGYLQRAYEGVPGFVVAEIAQEEVIQPVFEPEVLLQIENSMALPLVGACKRIEPQVYIRQNPTTNAIVSDAQIWALGSGYASSTRANIKSGNPVSALPVLTMRSDNPGIVENVIASRLMSHALSIEATTKIWAGDPASVDTDVIKFTAGTEIPVSWFVIDSVVDQPADLIQQRVDGAYVQQALLSPNLNLMKPWFRAESFDWHPKALLVTSGAKSEAIFLGDMHNLTSISINDLQNLHRICGFSEFNSFTMM